MKVKLGICFMLLGILLVCASLGLFLHNQQEQAHAQESVALVLPQIVEAIQEEVKAGENAQTTPALPEQIPEMTVRTIDGHDYIGFLSIPKLELELSVMADWSNSKLQKSPCRYTGNLHAEDLVVMAHNYWSHFGRLSKLELGDAVVFTDMDGNQHTFQVTAMDILGSTAVEEMTAGEYDLTLFTCTYGGQNRVTVRCDRAK